MISAKKKTRKSRRRWVSSTGKCCRSPSPPIRQSSSLMRATLKPAAVPGEGAERRAQRGSASLSTTWASATDPCSEGRSRCRPGSSGPDRAALQQFQSPPVVFAELCGLLDVMNSHSANFGYLKIATASRGTPRCAPAATRIYPRSYGSTAIGPPCSASVMSWRPGKPVMSGRSTAGRCIAGREVPSASCPARPTSFIRSFTTT